MKMENIVGNFMVIDQISDKIKLSNVRCLLYQQLTLIRSLEFRTSDN